MPTNASPDDFAADPGAGSPGASPAESGEGAHELNQSTSSRAEFPCDQCAAEMTWDPEADALSCEYCGNVVKVPRGEGTIVERALEDVGEAARGFGVDLRVVKCSNCGARVTFEGSRTTEECVYCGSANVLAQEANRNSLRPESLVPLDLGKEQARATFREWITGLWFRPNALKKIKAFQAKGIYVPFWTFDCEVNSKWSADAGYYYYVPVTTVVMVNGKPTTQVRMERRVRWEPAWGERDDAYDDDLVLASRGMSQELMLELGGFDTSGLVPYRPEYLAGWCAEEYQLDLEEGWEQGQKNVISYQEISCSGDVPGDTQRNLRVQNRIYDVRWKHVLLPIWSLQYHFNKKTYTVLINGQTGRVSGEAPLSWYKILGLGVGLAALAAVAVVIAKAS